MLYQNPVSSYSKAPWGLSVLSRVTGIFTGISISPGVLLRQLPNRYAIRAGQNLPDKEFRYLRTVIVTAAVYWGLSSQLRCNFNTLIYSSCPLALFLNIFSLPCSFLLCEKIFTIKLKFKMLKLHLTVPLNLPAPGRRQPIYVVFRLCIDLCFC